MGSVARMTKPYRALMEGKWKEAVRFYETNAANVQAPLTINRNTALHIAVYIRNMELLKNLLHMLDPQARHRRAEILDYLQSSSNVPKSRLRKKINIENGDSILHNAAYLSPSFSRDRPGEALRMQSDLQWFERKQLVEDGPKWLRRTAEACTIVAVLIATVAFTCIYTVPGGSIDTGRPLLLKATAFSVFATSDALSLCLSLTSVVVFLSIITSKMNEQDFRRSLPLKLVLGLTTLFLSVAFMMVAFSATLLLILSQRLHWAAIPIYTVACCPVTIFLLLQLPLYINISLFTINDLFAAQIIL
ncbi:hypothetical protein FEM48_ZijujUnG0088200 [Ziziphus jujuba var. spinosa]|uniref:PGG domain-containing protein n=1 Tax=Ziziphus jujuba var. spinosa TaxID=714518 RepID=A0A978U8K0_ZIZJJ|nr:ankyrin repeat-containing protein NPR4-like [Ziziphus jujuba var. spinosa]KAH7510786.1 hypothetical protein FEM48_ZijujUnG0088200 [Ziziphus jujuba var. spinosa]